MAFLLSPKSGGGVSYALTTAGLTSINEGTEQVYTRDEPGTVHPGDVLTWVRSGQATIDYYGDPDGEPLLHLYSSSPYTVQSIEGATLLTIDNGAPI